MKKILLIEDDKNISEMITEYLENDLYNIKQVFDGKSAIKEFKSSCYDLILLDIMIPQIDGISIMKEIRKTDFIPIIIITAKDSDTDKSIGLGLGADDYITKPFSLVELSARIKANIRRVTKYIKEQNDNKIINIKDLKINIKNYSVIKNNIELKLTHKEFEILKLLASNSDRVFSKEEIYTKIWNECYYGDDNIINVHMKRLRSKLSNGNRDTEYIKTLWGIGYKMEDK